MHIADTSKTHEQTILLDDADAVCRYVQLADQAHHVFAAQRHLPRALALNSCEESEEARERERGRQRESRERERERLTRGEAPQRDSPVFVMYKGRMVGPQHPGEHPARTPWGRHSEL